MSASLAPRVEAAVRCRAAMPEVDELVEDAELELELDAVRQRLPGCLDVEEIGEFQGQDRHVEKYDQNIHPDQVVHNLPGPHVADTLLEPETVGRFPDVKARDNEFLNKEDAELDFLVDNVRLAERLRVRRICSVHQDDNGEVEPQCVGDDHV